MVPLDSEPRLATALVIDGNDASRSALVNMLREFGLAEVTRPQCPRYPLEIESLNLILVSHGSPIEELSTGVA